MFISVTYFALLKNFNFSKSKLQHWCAGFPNVVIISVLKSAMNYMVSWWCRFGVFTVWNKLNHCLGAWWCRFGVFTVWNKLNHCLGAYADSFAIKWNFSRILQKIFLIVAIFALKARAQLTKNRKFTSTEPKTNSISFHLKVGYGILCGHNFLLCVMIWMVLNVELIVTFKIRHFLIFFYIIFLVVFFFFL